MDGKNEYREGLFPSGLCVTPEDGVDTEVNGQAAHQLFNEIDHGQVDERALVLAKQVCQSCTQLPFCETQTDELATELWHRGVGLSLVGGTAVKVTPSERQMRQERPKFAFNLTRIPSEPEAAVSVIRQAFRAGQLNAAGPTPKGVKAVSAAYLERLAEANPELHGKLAELGEDETARGLKFIFTALFQQKDFESFSKGEERQTRAGNPRYNPDIIDTSIDDPVVDRFLEDTVAISKLGFSKAAGKAAHFEPEYYAKLAEMHKPASMSWSDFDRLIGTNRNPIEALTRDQERTSAVRASDPTASSRTVRATVRHGQKEVLSETNVAELEAKYSDHDFVTPQLIKSIINSNVGNPEVALENIVQRVVKLQELYPVDHPYVRTSDLVLFSRNHRSHQKAGEAADTFAKTMKRLTEQYGNDPDVLPSDIRRFSTNYPTGADKELREYKTRLDHLRCTSDSRITDSIIRQCARRGITSPLEVAKIYDRRLIHDRYSYRAKKEADADALKPELVERIVCLYPSAEINQVSEQVYELVNKGILVFSRAEAYSLQGELHEDLDKIFSPKSQEYLTFSADFRAWTPVQRLAFAHYHHLVPLMYGREANTLQLEQLALSGKALESYYQEQLAPMLTDTTTSDAVRTLDLLEIDTDLSTYDVILGQAASRPLPRDNERLMVSGLRDASLVVGGKALYLRDPEYNWDWMEHTPDFAGWLFEKISGSYPPHQHEQAHRYITEAIDGGVLELLGENPGEYRLVFSGAFYENTATDLERAAVANAMGIDVLLYGSDLSTALSHRLGDTPLQAYVQRVETPEISEFTNEQLAEAREKVAQEALNLAEYPPLTQLLLTRFGNGYNFDKLTDKQWQTITDDLLEAYNRHIEHPNHQHEVYDETIRAQVTLAWTDMRGGDVHAMARLFSVVGDDYDTFIEQGLEYIRAQFESIPAARLLKTAKILDRVKTPVQEQMATAALSFVAPLHTYVDLDSEYTTDTKNGHSRQKASVPSAPRIPELDQHEAGKTAEQTIVDDSRPAALLEDEWVIIPSQQTERGFGQTATEFYLSQAGKHPLLKPEQEVELAKAIEAGVLAKEKLELGLVSDADRSDYERLVRIGEDAKQTFVHANLRLVISIAKRYPQGPNMSYIDYIQEGNLGLLTAIEKFDYTKGYKFSTYATNWIRQKMGRAQVMLGRTIHTPLDIGNSARYYHAFSAKTKDEQGHIPTDEEVLAQFGWSPAFLESVKTSIKQQPLSLNYKVNMDRGDIKEYGDLIEDGAARRPEAKLLDDETGYAFSELVTRILNPKTALLLALRHGIPFSPTIREIAESYNVEEGREYKSSEVAPLLGMTLANVRNTHLRAVRTLRQPENRKLLSYLLGHTDSPS